MPKTNIQESDVDTLVPDPQVRKEFGGVSDMCLWRWTHDPSLGFPPVIRIKNCCYRSRRALEEFKARLVRELDRAALAQAAGARRSREASRLTSEF